MTDFRKSIPKAYLSPSYTSTARSSISAHPEIYRLTNPLDAGSSTPRHVFSLDLPTLNAKPSQNFSLFSNASKDERDDAHNDDDEESLVQTPQQKKGNDASSIPNGGLRAWLQVLGGFFLLFNSWGIINTFGVYQAYYETGLLKSSTSSAISWIGSIQAFLLLIVGMLTGPLYDAGYFRYLLIFGSVMLVFGQMMLSLCTTYWQVLLAQAVCVGVGTGALFVPSIAILSTYFSTKIGLAIGIAASGSSLGGVIYPIVFQNLLPKLGFAWTTRVLGLILLATMIIPNISMKVRVLPASSRSLFDFPAFKIPAYSLQVAGFFIGFMGLYIPFFYAQVFAVQEKITSEEMAFYLLAIMNSSSVFGRKLHCLPLYTYIYLLLVNRYTVLTYTKRHHTKPLRRQTRPLQRRSTLLPHLRTALSLLHNRHHQRIHHRSHGVLRLLLWQLCQFTADDYCCAQHGCARKDRNETGPGICMCGVWAAHWHANWRRGAAEGGIQGAVGVWRSAAVS
jgi:MFS family permease